MASNLFGQPSKNDIRVGYIDPQLGYVSDISICEANEYAKINPGTTFLFKDGNRVLKYININEVNELTPSDLETTQDCEGINQKKECGPPSIQIYGGGGIGAVGNPVIGTDGALLAVDLVRGGHGYQYAPQVTANDNCNYGSGTVLTAVIGEVSDGVETYSDETDFEEYELCDPNDAGFGRRYGPNGEDLGPWEPNVYTKIGADPIRTEIEKYEEVVRRLARAPFWDTRRNRPTKITASDSTITLSQIYKVTDATFLEKQRADGVKDPLGWNEFMNSYAVSPVPPSNVKGSDYAATLFTMEWNEEFPVTGEYIFRGLCDNVAKLYLDNEKIFDLGGFRGPVKDFRKTIQEGIHNIRIDLLNVPVKEKVISQPQSGLVDISFTVYGEGKRTGTLNFSFVSEDGLHSFILKGNEKSKESRNETIKVKPNIKYKVTAISTRGEIEQGIVQNGKKNKEGGLGSSNKIFADYIGSSNDNDDIQITVGSGKFESKNKKTAKNSGRSTYDLSFFVEGSGSTTSSSTSSTSDIQTKKVFNTVDYIDKANRKLWRTNVYGRGGFINEQGVCPFDTSVQLDDNPYAGTHQIIWDNIDFPVDGNYSIDIEVDDNVNLTFSGTQGDTTIVKKGFSSSDKSTGKTTETKFFKAGKYKITADLEQIPGGKFGFTDGKGINPMALAVEVSVSTTTKEVISPKSWNENPMGASVTIDAPEPPVPQEPVPAQEGRCPNNPLWTTRFSTKTEKWYPVKFTSAWSNFMNRYAISPVKPLDTPGSDKAGVVYSTSWDVDIPYDGFYGVKGTVDNSGKIIIDGKVVLGSTRSPYTFRQGPDDPDSRTLGIPAITRAFADGLTSADIRVEAAKQGFKINPNAQPLLAQGSQNQTSSASAPAGTEIKLDGFNVEDPKLVKTFLTKGIHTITAEVYNKPIVTENVIEQKIFRTTDWQVASTSSTNTSQGDIKPKFIEKDGKYYLEVSGSGSGEVSFVMDVDDREYVAGLAAKEIVLPSDSGNINFRRTIPTLNGVDLGIGIPQKETIEKSGNFTSGKTYGPIEIIGATSGAGTPKVSDNKLGLLDTDGTDENIKFTIKDIKNTSTTSTSITGGYLSSGTTKNNITYEGPSLFHYTDSRWGEFMNKNSVSPYLLPFDVANSEINGTKTYTWKNVKFPESGQYRIAFQADNIGSLYIGGTKVLSSASYVASPTFENVNITTGTYDVVVEVENLKDSTDIFNNNPTGFAIDIRKNVTLRSQSKTPWSSNPMGISAILVPPPCPKKISGRGVVTDVLVQDPGNGYLPPSSQSTYPVSLRLKSVVVENPGVNYNCGVDQIQITPSNGAVLDYVCDPFGKIKEVKVLNPGLGFTEYPQIQMVSPPGAVPTGINASFRPQFEVVRDPIVTIPQKLIQVTDLVGLKQNGYIEGRAYYGAVFYKDGVRYAGFYETAGDLVQVYDTLQESVTATVTTAASAIQRQGTDTELSSNNPRLNIPGTPENLI